MDRDQKIAIKHLCQTGAYSPFETLVNEILYEFNQISYTGDTNQLIFEHGKKAGVEDFVSELKTRINKYANEQ